MNTLGDRIRILREKKKLTQEELGKLIGVQRAAINKYESGAVVNLKRSTIAKLAQVLDTAPSYLMFGENPRPDNAIAFPATAPVPVVGKIACGEPITAEQNIEGTFQAPISMKATFCLKCKGDSMVEAGIFDGDIVFIREQPEVENGQIAAVQIEDDADQPSEMFATLKKVYHTGDTLLLMPMNGKLKVKEFKGEDIKRVRILGKYVGLTRFVDEQGG